MSLSLRLDATGLATMVLLFEEEIDKIGELVTERYWVPLSRTPFSQYDVMDDVLDKLE